jgi:uncharacterized protein (DUF1697 family)
VLCGDMGWEDIETYIQSGNLVFTAAGAAAAFEETLEREIAKRFGFHSDVVIRSAGEWRSLLDSNPFAREAETEPNRVLAGLAKRTLAGGAAAAIAQKAAAGERVEESGGALWFHYPAGVGQSKLTPALIDRAAGSPVTARNWRTLLRLGEMIG